MIEALLSYRAPTKSHGCRVTHIRGLLIPGWNTSSRLTETTLAAKQTTSLIFDTQIAFLVISFINLHLQHDLSNVHK